MRNSSNIDNFGGKTRAYKINSSKIDHFGATEKECFNFEDIVTKYNENSFIGLAPGTNPTENFFATFRHSFV